MPMHDFHTSIQSHEYKTPTYYAVLVKLSALKTAKINAEIHEGCCMSNYKSSQSVLDLVIVTSYGQICDTCIGDLERELQTMA